MKAKHGTGRANNRSGVMSLNVYVPFDEYIHDVFHYCVLCMHAIWQAADTFRPTIGCLTVLKCDVYVCEGRVF